jgi:hypothetical protein
MRKHVEYRVKASKLAAEASDADDPKQAERLQKLGANWIKLAENEEWLQDHSIAADQKPR